MLKDARYHKVKGVFLKLIRAYKRSHHYLVVRKSIGTHPHINQGVENIDAEPFACILSEAAAH